MYVMLLNTTFARIVYYGSVGREGKRLHERKVGVGVIDNSTREEMRELGSLKAKFKIQSHRLFSHRLFSFSFAVSLPRVILWKYVFFSRPELMNNSSIIYYRNSRTA